CIFSTMHKLNLCGLIIEDTVKLEDVERCTLIKPVKLELPLTLGQKKDVESQVKDMVHGNLSKGYLDIQQALYRSVTDKQAIAKFSMHTSISIHPSKGLSAARYDDTNIWERFHFASVLVNRLIH